MRTYPMVELLVRHGTTLAVLAAIGAIAGGAYIAFSAGNVVYAVVAVIGGGILFALLKSYVELVTIIADMMLPNS